MGSNHHKLDEKPIFPLAPGSTLAERAAAMANAAWIMAGFPVPDDIRNKNSARIGQLSPPNPDEEEFFPIMNLMEPRFLLGKTFATAAVTAFAEESKIDLTRFMWRHHCGDWGDLDAEDKQANENALEHGGRIFSSYHLEGKKLYVITEVDRSMTTILFATEY